MTPRQLNLAADEYSKRKQIEQNESIAQAYLISRWVWQKKIDIKKILDADLKKKPMSDKDMLERVKALNAVFGGEVVTYGEK